MCDSPVRWCDLTSVIVGSGGFGREVLWVCRNKRSQGKVVFADDTEEKKGVLICNTKVVGTIEDVPNSVKNPVFICGVGSPDLKKSFVNRIELLGPPYNIFTSLVHESVLMSRYVNIGDGTVICAGSVLTTQVSVGKHVSLNLDCTVGHDTVIEDYVNIAPGVHISGYCVLKEGCDIGTGANILPRVTIGKNAVIGAGACVTKDVPDDSVAVGVPARAVKRIGGE